MLYDTYISARDMEQWYDKDFDIDQCCIDPEELDVLLYS